MVPTLSRVLSLQVGLPRRHGHEGAEDPLDRPWESAFVKTAVEGPVRVTRLGLEGDGQADRVNHGGVDKALLAYAAAHYARWGAELPGHTFPFGGFGENLTVEGQDEGAVCVGDVYDLDGALLEVSQPRSPCWKIARRWRVPDLTDRVRRTLRIGWYLRVLQEGVLAPGAPVRLVARPHPEWPVDRAMRVMLAKREAPGPAAELAAVPALSPVWRDALLGRGD